MTAWRYQEARRLRDKGYSMREIAAMMGVCHGTIGSLLRLAKRRDCPGRREIPAAPPEAVAAVWELARELGVGR